MSENEKGFYLKYRVEKIDTTNPDPKDAWYFVLRADTKCKDYRHLQVRGGAFPINYDLSEDIIDKELDEILKENNI